MSNNFEDKYANLRRLAVAVGGDCQREFEELETLAKHAFNREVFGHALVSFLADFNINIAPRAQQSQPADKRQRVPAPTPSVPSEQVLAQIEDAKLLITIKLVLAYGTEEYLVVAKEAVKILKGLGLGHTKGSVAMVLARARGTNRSDFLRRVAGALGSNPALLNDVLILLWQAYKREGSRLQFETIKSEAGVS